MDRLSRASDLQETVLHELTGSQGQDNALLAGNSVGEEEIAVPDFPRDVIGPRNTGVKRPKLHRNTDQGSNISDRNDVCFEQDEQNHVVESFLVASRGGVQQATVPLLACPFHKREPLAIPRARSCLGPGWKTVHRVKEHVYRHHRAPSQCPRCGQIFEDHDQLNAHCRALIPCQGYFEILKPAQTLVEAQEKELRSKKRSKNTTGSEEDKWRRMYQIIFPNEDSVAIPSPYYEANSTSHDNWTALKTYLTQHMPEIIFDQGLCKGYCDASFRDEFLQVIRQELETAWNTHDPGNARSKHRTASSIDANQVGDDFGLSFTANENDDEFQVVPTPNDASKTIELDPAAYGYFRMSDFHIGSDEGLSSHAPNASRLASRQGSVKQTNADMPDDSFESFVVPNAYAHLFDDATGADYASDTALAHPQSATHDPSTSSQDSAALQSQEQDEYDFLIPPSEWDAVWGDLSS